MQNQQYFNLIKYKKGYRDNTALEPTNTTEPKLNHHVAAQFRRYLSGEKIMMDLIRDFYRVKGQEI